MQLSDLDPVLAVECSAYPFPWTRGNFIDSLAAGYRAEVIEDEMGRVFGYSVAMAGFEEMHLLNLTVAPALQGRGHGLALLQALVGHCRGVRARQLWLEVRVGNGRARALYRRFGFVEIGLRRDYYPAPEQRREDATVMCLQLEPRDES